VACHKVDGQGGEVGVDLSQIGGKFDRPHLIESLLEPSRQIVEGYRTSNMLMIDGQVLSGIIRSQNDQQIVLVDSNAKEHQIEPSMIETISSSSVSIMPEGLASALSPQEFTDLIAYLESLRSGEKQKPGAGIAGPISLPADFQLKTVATGLDGAVALEVLPDGRILICEQVGRVRVVENGKLLDEPFVTLPVDAYWERGVIGVTHDPAFPTQPYIYVCWVAKEPYPHHRVSRFTMQGNVAVPGSEQVLLVGDDQTQMGGKVPAGHQGGALHFGGDGKLYIGLGEQTAETPSQHLDTLLGKVLRINADGSIPKDNPFYHQTAGKYRSIWLRGVRNPFTFAFRSSDGLMLINDVGGKSEEINVGRAGANYGWPVVEHGEQVEYQQSEFTGPIYHYPQASINGADFCPSNASWPESWQGRYFFADYVHGWVHTIDPDDPADMKPFATGMRRPVDLRFSSDGCLYVLLRNAWVIDDKFAGGTGSLLQIRHVPGSLVDPAAHSTVTSSSQNNSGASVRLTQDAIDESAGNLPAFKIDTDTATYFLEKSGGGLSSLIDRDGNNWIGFEPTQGSRAGGEFRGFPNAVFGKQGGYFHPRNANTKAMDSAVETVLEDYVSIVVESVDGLYAGRYEFYPTHCTFAITRMPAQSKYWVLYEGTPGGDFRINDWWMTSAVDAPQPLSRRHEGDIPDQEWIAFGAAGGKRSILLLNHSDDDHPDTFYEMHNQMTVFGFGRDGMNAFLSEAGQRFSIALVESTEHAVIAAFASQLLAPVAPEDRRHAIVSTAESADTFKSQLDRPILGPQPGDVYREYAVHNGGNLNWRVTDPAAKSEGAQDFLPNPILSLNIKDLSGAIRAEAVIDRWGGHAGTKDKRIRFNGHDWIRLPELATTPPEYEPESYYSQDNPVVAVPLEQLKRGNNVLEGTVGPDNSVAWGQWGLYSLILRIYYDPAVKPHATGEISWPRPGDTLGEHPTIQIACDGDIERVQVIAFYDGYDEDGDGVFLDWHGSRFQPFNGQAADLENHVGTIDASLGQRNLVWDTHWIPDQQPRAIKLVAHFQNNDDLCYVSDIVDGLSLEREGYSVKQYRAINVPEKFGVRIGRTKSCQIPIPDTDDLSMAVESVLHLRTWEAHDSHHEPFKLNGHEHLNRGKNHHYDYDLLPIPVDQLKGGENIFTIHSKTVHHMLEVLWPGPAITVRYQTR